MGLTGALLILVSSLFSADSQVLYLAKQNFCIQTPGNVFFTILAAGSFAQ